MRTIVGSRRNVKGQLTEFSKLTSFTFVISILYTFNLMVSTETSWWNILNLKIYTTPGYTVSLILLNLGHVFRFRIVSRMCSIYTFTVTIYFRILWMWLPYRCVLIWIEWCTSFLYQFFSFLSDILLDSRPSTCLVI